MNDRVQQLWSLIRTAVSILKENDGTMKQRDLEIATARATGESTSTMSYVIANAVAEDLMDRGGLGRWDHLTLTERGRTYEFPALRR